MSSETTIVKLQMPNYGACVAEAMRKHLQEFVDEMVEHLDEYQVSYEKDILEENVTAIYNFLRTNSVIGGTDGSSTL